MTTQFIALWAQNKSSEKRLLRVAIHLNMSILYEQYKLTIICFYRDKIGSYCRHLSTVRWENDGSSLWPIRTWRHRVTQAGYWPLVRGIHRSPVISPYRGQWRGALMFTFNKGLSKQPRCWWFETPTRSSWCHRNGFSSFIVCVYWER